MGYFAYTVSISKQDFFLKYNTIMIIIIIMILFL